MAEEWLGRWKHGWVGRGVVGYRVEGWVGGVVVMYGTEGWIVDNLQPQFNGARNGSN